MLVCKEMMIAYEPQEIWMKNDTHSKAFVSVTFNIEYDNN